MAIYWSLSQKKGYLPQLKSRFRSVQSFGNNTELNEALKSNSVYYYAAPCGRIAQSRSLLEGSSSKQGLF